MRQKSNSTPASSETLVRNIRRATRKHHAAEEKIRIVLDGLRGETSIAELGNDFLQVLCLAPELPDLIGRRRACGVPGKPALWP